MLKDAKAFSGFAVDDVARAKDFYGTTLGLETLRGDGSPDVVPARYQLNADETIDIGGPNMAGRWSLPGGRLT